MDLMTAIEGAERKGYRYAGLDLLRAVAIAWVVLYHSSNFDLVDYNNPVVSVGWIGVDIFFVLSGFLIGGQFFKEIVRGSRVNIFSFYARRALRTLPAYGFILALYFTLSSWREFDGIAPLWQFVTFSENIFFKLDHSMSFSHVWSLCVEEQFYLILPFVIFLLSAHPNIKRVVAFVLCVLMAGIAFRYMSWVTYVAPHDIGGVPTDGFNVGYVKHVYYPTWNRLDGLLFGVAAAALRSFLPRHWLVITRYPNVILLLGIAGALATAFLFFRQLQAQLLPAVLGYPTLAAAITLIVISATCEKSMIARYPVPGVKGLAAISYSLYLSHKIVFHAVSLYVAPLLVGHPFCVLSAAIVLALIAGTALYWGVERPFLLLRNHLDRRSGDGSLSSSPVFLG